MAAPYFPVLGKRALLIPDVTEFVKLHTKVVGSYPAIDVKMEYSNFDSRYPCVNTDAFVGEV